MSKMKFSDTTQEYYRAISKKDLARTKTFLESNWNAYSAFSECQNEEEAFAYIEDVLMNEDLAYGWASRLSTLTEKACDQEYF